MKTFIRTIAGIFILLLASAGTRAYAAGTPLPIGPTSAEFLRLPPYCKARLGGSPEEKKAWDQQMGHQIFLHVHHYCFGLNSMNRARFESDKKLRSYYIERSIANFNYVIKAWPNSHPMAAQARRLKAQVEFMQMKR